MHAGMGVPQDRISSCTYLRSILFLATALFNPLPKATCASCQQAALQSLIHAKRLSCYAGAAPGSSGPMQLLMPMQPGQLGRPASAPTLSPVGARTQAHNLTTLPGAPTSRAQTAPVSQPQQANQSVSPAAPSQQQPQPGSLRSTLPAASLSTAATAEAAAPLQGIALSQQVPPAAVQLPVPAAAPGSSAAAETVPLAPVQQSSASLQILAGHARPGAAMPLQNGPVTDVIMSEAGPCTNSSARLQPGQQSSSGPSLAEPVSSATENHVTAESPPQASTQVKIKREAEVVPSTGRSEEESLSNGMAAPQSLPEQAANGAPADDEQQHEPPVKTEAQQIASPEGGVNGSTVFKPAAPQDPDSAKADNSAKADKEKVSQNGHLQAPPAQMQLQRPSRPQSTAPVASEQAAAQAPVLAQSQVTAAPVEQPVLASLVSAAPSGSAPPGQLPGSAPGMQRPGSLTKMATPGTSMASAVTQTWLGGSTASAIRPASQQGEPSTITLIKLPQYTRSAADWYVLATCTTAAVKGAKSVLR